VTTGPVEYVIRSTVLDSKTGELIGAPSGGAGSSDPPSPELLDAAARGAVQAVLRRIALAADGKQE
jgi:hypothetical protein